MTEQLTAAPDTLTAALAWQAAGCSVIRAATDGTKAPLGTWATYQHTPPSEQTLRAWFTGGHPGIGIVCGAVSGHLELLELEGRAIADGTGRRFLDALEEHGHGDLAQRILRGYTEVSPSGGLHILYRVTGGVDGNRKLAQRPGPNDPDTGRPTVLPLIETRGEHGFVVVAPSNGSTHPSGGAWKATSGAPDTIPTITPDDRDALHAIARLFDEMPPPEPIPDPPAPSGGDTATAGRAPGEAFNHTGTWPEILEPAGWTRVRQLAGRAFWRRPGKTIGISAVTGGEHGDYFYSWSTSTELPVEQAMSKWRVYALAHHGGDFAAAASALRAKGYGDRRPAPTRPVLTVIGGGAATSAAAGTPAVDAAIDLTETTFERSDDGNALLLADQFGAVIRYAPERARWLTWTGTRWEWAPPGGGAVRELAKRVARAMRAPDRVAEQWKQRSLSAIGTTATLTQAATDTRLTVRLAELDAAPWELNTPGGVVDLRSGRTRPHDPAALHTRITACAPDPAADDTRWQQFLADTFTGHPDLPGYVQRLVGYSITGVVREHVLPFAFGAGANGKGVLLETLRAVLGDYATTAPNSFLMAQKYAQHETEIARLAGARMVVCSEVNQADKFDEARVKQLTGGDTITARFMRMDHFSFQPSHTLWLMGNHQPVVTGGGHSFWRRLRILPFDNIVPPEKIVADLQTVLAAEHGPAVLAWAVAGAAAYCRTGLGEPPSVRAATAAYEHDQDTVARFIEDACYVGGGTQVKVRTDQLRIAYDRWCLAEGATPVSATAFGATLRSRYGVGLAKSSGRKFYTNLALAAPDDESDERKDLA